MDIIHITMYGNTQFFVWDINTDLLYDFTDNARQTLCLMRHLASDQHNMRR